MLSLALFAAEGSEEKIVVKGEGGGMVCPQGLATTAWSWSGVAEETCSKSGRIGAMGRTGGGK